MTLLNPADVYVPPGQPGHTGFTLADYGRRVVLKDGTGQQTISPGWFQAVVINPSQGGGANRYRETIEGCDPTVIGPGSLLEVEPGNMAGPTRQGVTALIARDPEARWDPSAKNGRGAPVGGCMAAGTCGISPRLMAVAAFDVDAWSAGRQSGRSEVVVVVKILGVWLEGMAGGDVVGYLTYYPAVAAAGQTVSPDSSFLRTAMLVR